MEKLKGRRLSPALLVAVVALVAALGGGAVAGVTVSKLNNKEKKQVRKISKKQAKKLDNKIELLPGPQGEQGPTGETGPQGIQGPAGPSTGPAGGDLTGNYPNPSVANETINSSKIIDGQVRAADLGAIILAQNTGTVADNSSADLAVFCPAGTRVITGGGGINLLEPPSGVSLTASFATGGNAWRIVVRNDSGAVRNILVEAYCLEE